MAKGGYRAGGGRPPGIKETKPRRRKKPAGDSNQAKIRELLEQGINGKAIIYEAMLRRVGNNETLTLSEQKLFLSIHEELAAAIGDKPPESVETGEKLEPLEYALRVMNDPNEPKDRRDRMAIAAMPFRHIRKGEAGFGKKEDRAARAKIAGMGKYASMQSPFRVK